MNPKESADLNCLFKPDISLICPVLIYQVLLFIIIVTLLSTRLIQQVLTSPAIGQHGNINHSITYTV